MGIYTDVGKSATPFKAKYLLLHTYKIRTGHKVG